MKTLVLVAAFALLASPPGPASAGIVDSPIPALQGQHALHLYSVPGVVNAGGLGTFFSCTSTSRATIQVSVEVFNEAGDSPCNDASAVSLSVAPGASVMFATQNVNSAFFSAQILTPGPLYLPLGSARILSSAKGLVCTAFLADAYSAPPTSMAQLNVVAKTKQRGD